MDPALCPSPFWAAVEVKLLLVCPSLFRVLVLYPEPQHICSPVPSAGVCLPAMRTRGMFRTSFGSSQLGGIICVFLNPGFFGGAHGGPQPVMKLFTAHNCFSLLQHLSAARLFNGIKINQWPLAFATPQQFRRKWRRLRSGLGPAPAAVAVTPHNPNGLLHAPLT